MSIEVEFSASWWDSAFEIWIDGYVWNSRHCKQEWGERRAARWLDALLYGKPRSGRGRAGRKWSNNKVKFRRDNGATVPESKRPECARSHEACNSWRHLRRATFFQL